MNRVYIVAMSLMVVAGVMLSVASDHTGVRILGIVISVCGAAGVFAAIMTRRNSK